MLMFKANVGAGGAMTVKKHFRGVLASSLAAFWLIPAMPLLAQTVVDAPETGSEQSEIKAGEAALELNRVADAYLASVTKANPFIVYFSLSDIMEPVHSAMPDNSPAALSRFNAEEDALYEALLGADETALVVRGDWVAYQSMKEMMEASIGLRQCRLEGWNVSHMDGWQTAFTDIADRQPVATETE
jgi:hypothetical protein